MRRCEKCGVQIIDSSRLCPLCQGELSGEPSGEHRFPVLPRRSALPSAIFKFVALASVIAVTACLAVCMSMGGLWWLYAAAGVASGWIVTGVLIVMRHNVAKCIIWTTSIINLLALIWDFATDYNGWSVDYVLPIACCCAMLAMALAAKIKRQRIEDYIIYLIIDIIFGIIPFILYLCGALRVVYPSIICVASSAVSLASLIIFEGKSLLAEITRRTHL